MAAPARTAAPQLNRAFWIPPALLLIAASLSKSSQPIQFLYELSNYGFHLPLGLEALLAILLPALEMLLGSFLLLCLSSRAAVGSLALLLIFSGGIIAALPAGYLHRCGCLGPEKLDPSLALIKNACALLLLLIGFLPVRQKLEENNPWGALGVIIGAAAVNIEMLFFGVLVAIMAIWHGKAHIFAYLLGILLGVILHYAGFPLLAILAAATVVYFLRVKKASGGIAAPIWITALILCLTAFNFANPPGPKPPPASIKVGKPLPMDLHVAQPFPRNDRRQSLIVFLQPDCDECKDWLPLATAIWRLQSLPPLVGLAPGTADDLEAYRQKENIPFDIYPMSAKTFNRAARRTPLLILVEADTVRRIFPEGNLPSPSFIETILRNETP